LSEASRREFASLRRLGTLHRVLKFKQICVRENLRITPYDPILPSSYGADLFSGGMALGTAFEVWIRRKPNGQWMLFDVRATRGQAQSLALARRQQDQQRDYEVREAAAPEPDEPETGRFPQNPPLL